MWTCSFMGQMCRPTVNIRVPKRIQNTDPKHWPVLIFCLQLHSSWSLLLLCLLFNDSTGSKDSKKIITMTVVTVQWQPSLVWHCWLDVRKSIRPVKIEWRGVGVVSCQERDADCLHGVHWCLCCPETPSPLASLKSRLVLPFWYRLTEVVLEKRPLNGCRSSSASMTVVIVVWANEQCWCRTPYIHCVPKKWAP